MKLDGLHCISLIEIYRQNTAEAELLFNWGAFKPHWTTIFHQICTWGWYCQSWSRRLIALLNMWILLHVIPQFLSAQKNFWCHWIIGHTGNFAILHQNSPREGFFFSCKCVLHSSLHRTNLITSKINISMPSATYLSPKIIILSHLASEA